MNANKTPRGALLALLVLLALAALLRFGHLACHRSAPLGSPEQQFLHSDTRAFAIWAEKIAAGDLLCRDTYHPYMDWMEEVAPLEQFEEWWGGKEIYHQAPLYPYLLAGSYALTGGPLPLLVFQVVLAVLAIYLLFLLGQQLIDTWAGLAAAAAAALFAPAVVLDAFLLRSSLIASLTIITLWQLHRVHQQPGPGRALRAGVLLGLGYLLKPTGLVMAFLAPLALVLLAPPGPRRRWLPALAGGFLLCLVPLALRNLAVGAPVTALGTRGPETIYHGNNKHGDPGFMQLPPADEYREAMQEAHRSPFAALATAIGTWPEEGRLGWWLWHLGRKVQCILMDYEHPNNANFYYYRGQTPGLRLLPTFGLYAGLIAVGLILAVHRSPRRRELLLPLAVVLALVAGLTAAYVLGRYRAPLVLLLTLPLGATVSALVAWCRQGRFLLAGGTLLVALLLSWFSCIHAPIRVYFTEGSPRFISRADSRLVQALEANRFQEFKYAALELQKQGRKEEAARVLDRHLAGLRRIGRQEAAQAGPLGMSIFTGSRAKSLRQAADLLEELGYKDKATRLRLKAQ